MARVAVIIPNFNGAHHLPECLGALSRQTYTDFETVVVDNGSTDSSLDVLSGWSPAVEAIRLGSNRGFSAAVNEGIAATTAPYVVLLNNDTSAADDWLERLVAAMDETPDAGFGASKLVRYDDPSTLDAAGDTFIASKLSGTGIGRGEPASRYSDRTWVFGACAAAAIYRREMLDDIGLFDEDFFLTHEDVDLSMRAQIAGYRCVYAADAVVRHKRRASYHLQSPEMEVIGLRNRLWVVGKNTPVPLLVLWIFGSLPHVIVMTLRRFGWGGRRQTNDASRGAVLSSHAARGSFPAVWSGLKRLPAKRRAVGHLRRAGSRALLRAIRTCHDPVVPHEPA